MTSSSLAEAASNSKTNCFASILCCMCGIPLQSPNPANTCADCLASSADVTRGIRTEATLHQCRGCQRWCHKDGGKWMSCELESRELMSLCLSHLKSGLTKSKIRLVDASWIWTEPHSMRLKIRLTIQKAVASSNNTILQQSFVVVFIVRNQQCVECQAMFRQGSWKSLVQVRQRVRHKRTFLYLEQVILKHGAHRGCLSIETFRNGMDFYFPDKGKAARFISFLEQVVPIKVKTSKKLISTDDKSNVSNFKYTNLVEICPLCREDLLWLPKSLARQLGNISQLVFVKAISNVIHLIDPNTGQTASLTPEAYWRNQQDLVPLITAARSRMTNYVVLAKEPILHNASCAKKKRPTRKHASRLAQLTLMKQDEMTTNSHAEQLQVTSHMGYLFRAGDVCVGYDFTTAQFVHDQAEQMRAADKLPPVVVVRKLYGAAAAAETADASQHESTMASNKTLRKWKLQRLDVDRMDEDGGDAAEQTAKRGRRAKKKQKQIEQQDMDHEDFLREIEADKEMRNNINLYKHHQASQNQKDEDDTSMNGNDDDDDDDQKVTLDELLDGLALDDGPDDDDRGQDDADAANDDDGWKQEGDKAAKDGIAYVGRKEARHVQDKEAAIAVTTPTTATAFGKTFSAQEFNFL